MGRSIRTADWRYTEWPDPKGNLAGTELYDEQNDPQENVNLAGEAANAEKVKQLAEQLKAG